MPTVTQSGSILLRFAITLFLVSILLAGGTTFLRWRQSEPASDPASATPIEDDPLQPTITIDSELNEHTATLQSNLITPLRQYYATQPEHLDTITVEPSPDTTYIAAVTITLETPDYTATHRFGYGTPADAEAETEQEFPPWDPGLLDQEI